MSVALLAEGVDRNSKVSYGFVDNMTSPSSRRAWIEMDIVLNNNFGTFVALLAEGVDRNYVDEKDRIFFIESPSSRRAWIEILTG